MARLASGTGRPSNWPELTRRPCSLSVYAGLAAAASALAPLAARPPPGRSASSNFLANSKSRSSWPGHRHDGAGAVLHQHVVGDPDRDRLPGGRVHRVAAGEDAGLLPLADLAGDQVLAPPPAGGTPRPPPAAPAVVSASTSGCSGASTMNVAPKTVSGRVVKTRIAARSSASAVRLRVRRSPIGKTSSAPSDPPQPVPLRRRGAVRPVHLRLVVQVGQQPVGVLGDPEEPLLQRPLLHHRAAALAAAVDDLLVGEHGLVVGAPVDRRRLLVGLPRLEELEEDPLGPLVVARIGGRELVPPVEHPADPLELAAEVLDVLRDQDRRG